MAEIKELKKEDWNRFVIEQGGSFLQSYEWGEFQKSIGREVFYLNDIPPASPAGNYGEARNFQALVIKYQMPLRRNYLFCPHGPVLASDIKTCGFLAALQDLAKKEKSVFLRVEPCVNCTKDDLSELCFEKSKDIQPHKTLVLDLNLSEEELLAQMGEKTRYNIRLAERKGVGVKNFQFSIFPPTGDLPKGGNFQSIFNEKFKEFWKLLNQTAKRQNIKLHDESYYEKQLSVNSENFKNVLFIAYFQGKAIAANMVNIFGNRATYVHGGADNEYRSLMAPHLLQWEQIKYDKQNGCKIYDFWGCDDEKWPGVSRFKKGFGGREIEWCGTHDYVFDRWWHKIYKAARSILR